jgi:hypothetical protein
MGVDPARWPGVSGRFDPVGPGAGPRFPEGRPDDPATSAARYESARRGYAKVESLKRRRSTYGAKNLATESRFREEPYVHVEVPVRVEPVGLAHVPSVARCTGAST